MQFNYKKRQQKLVYLKVNIKIKLLLINISPSRRHQYNLNVYLYFESVLTGGPRCFTRAKV
jgi:hypothetical protein